MPKRVEKDPVTREWCERARAAFAKRGRGAQRECAQAVKCSEGTITQLLKGKNGWSSFVVSISAYLGIPPPTVRVSDLREVAILTGVSQLLQSGRERAVDLVHALVEELVGSPSGAAAPRLRGG